MGWNTVKLMHEALRKACMTRPSDAMWGKPYNGTATDWVTRGHLTPTHLSHQDQSNCVTSLRTGGEQEAGYGGLMYSRASVRSTTTSRALPRVEENTERLNSRDPWAINYTTDCGKVYSLACAWGVYLNTRLTYSPGGRSR